MSKTVIVLALALMLALNIAAPAVFAENETPTIAVLRFGPAYASQYVENALLEALAGVGLINEVEAAALAKREEIAGEHLNILWGDAQFDFASAQTLARSQVDNGVDIIVAISTPMTQAALNASSDLPDPPIILFADVFEPYAAGIAQASCLKPAHVTGVTLETRYDDILPLLLLQDPDIETIGVVYSSAEISGALGAQRIAEVAADYGLTVLDSAVNSVSDLSVATDGLIAKGAQALVVPADLITVAGLPVLMSVAAENGIPVFHSIVATLQEGATVAASASRYAWQGELLAATLMGHLSKELDIAKVGIGSINNLVVGVNLDVAAHQGVELSRELIERADVVIRDGQFVDTRVAAVLEYLDFDAETRQRVLAEYSQLSAGASPSQLSPELNQLIAVLTGPETDRAQEVAAYFAGVACTEETIAEQQAALDAGEA